MDKLRGCLLNGLVVICGVLCCCLLDVNGDCGGYLAPGTSDTGDISSPNYPGNYGNNENCIWLLEAPESYAVSLSLGGVAGEQDGAACTDYLQIRNGSSEHTIEYDECNSIVPVTIQARWLWVRFTSNVATVNTGFTASWSIVSDASASTTEPFVYCPMEFKCINKECVPWSYKCDGYNDCGCDGKKCDEDSCSGFNLSMFVKIGIGVGAGVGFFIITFFGIGILDIYLKKRSERKYLARMDLQKKLIKQKRARHMASLLVGADGSRKNSTVPGSTTTGSTLTVKQ